MCMRGRAMGSDVTFLNTADHRSSAVLAMRNAQERTVMTCYCAWQLFYWFRCGCGVAVVIAAVDCCGGLHTELQHVCALHIRGAVTAACS